MTTALQTTLGTGADGAPVLTVSGEIDLNNAGDFRDRLGAALTPGNRLVVDLTGVTYLDSAALAVLFAQADHVSLRIAPMNESLMTISGLTELTEIEVVRP